MRETRPCLLGGDRPQGVMNRVSQRAALVERFTGPGQEFEIVERLVNGVPMRVYASGVQTLREVALASADHGGRMFVVYGDERWTHAEHGRLVSGLAQCLHEEYGLRKGDRVAVSMRNYPEWAPILFATQVLGLVLVPLNAWWTRPELRYAIADAGVRLVVADGERVALLAPHLNALGDVPLIEVRGASRSAPGVRRWDDVMASLDLSATPPAVDVNPDDDATILYTSGTTGRPNGAIATHRNHCTNLRNAQLGALVNGTIAAGGDAPAADPASPQPGVLCTFPLFHISGITSLGNAALTGGKLVLQYKWDCTEARDLVHRERLTSVAGVPTVIGQLLDDAVAFPERWASLTGMSAGGGPVPPDLIRRIGATFRGSVSPVNGYGLTETTSAVAVNSGTDYLARPDTVGRCQPGTDLRVVEPETGQDMPEGDVGELWFRGPSVVRGYWNNPSATSAAFTDGWFRTGDLGRVVDGWIYVMDRMKDVVIRGGENIYCAEVEAALFDHPAVEDVAVIGIPHESLGEEAVAIVAIRTGTSVTELDLQRHVAGCLASFKVPARVVFRSEPLPRTPSGKVLKRDLRSEVQAKVGEWKHG